MTTTNTLLRQATRADFPGLYRVRMAVLENRLTSTIIGEEQYVDAIENTGRGWVIEDAGEIVAFAVGNRLTGNIWALFVDPAHDRRGHGRRLHDVMVNWLFAQGLARLNLSTGIGTRAQRFYEIAGWQFTGPVGDDEAGYVLQNPALHNPALHNLALHASTTESKPVAESRIQSRLQSRLQSLGLTLPPPTQPPPGVVLPFRFVHIVGRRALISGHGPQNADGSFALPLGKVGREVSLEQAVLAARLTGLSMLGSLQRALGDLDRIVAWTRVFGMVNSAPGFNRQPTVINGFSDLILEVFGAQVGAHSRSAVGMAELPFDIPVEIEAEVEIRD